MSAAVTAKQRAPYGAKSGRTRTLHPAERRYLLSAAQGLTAAETAREHGVSLHTVNSSLKQAKTALGARTIAHAVALCIALGEFTGSDVRKAGSK